MTIDLSGNVVPRYMGAHGSLTMKPTKLFGSTPGAHPKSRSLVILLFEAVY